MQAGLLLEYARATNYSHTLISIVALSFYMHGVRASYNEAIAATGSFIVCTCVRCIGSLRSNPSRNHLNAFFLNLIQPKSQSGSE